MQYGETVVLCAAAAGPPRPGIRLLPADLRLSRADRRGRQVSRRLPQARRPADDEGNAHRAADGPPDPPAVPRVVTTTKCRCQAFVLASDRQNDGDVLAMNGAAAALGISPLPFQGPLGSVRLGHIDGKFVPFPTHDELEESDLDLIVSGSKDAVLMIEGFAREMPEDRMAEAIAKAHDYIREICDLQHELVAEGRRAEDGST